MQRQVQRRARPMEMGPSSPPDESHLGSVLPEATWVTPIPDVSVAPVLADPGEIAEFRESIRLAFVTALQHLPARQRAALLLCEVLRWPVAEAAELLESSVAAVNSALQRARATLAKVTPDAHADPLGRCRRGAAWSATSTRSSATTSRAWCVCSGPTPSSRCRPLPCGYRVRRTSGAGWSSPARAPVAGSRLLPTSANGSPAFGQYRPDPDGGFAPWAIQVLEISGGKIAGMSFFLDLLDHERLFPAFGLPPHLDA